MATMDFIGFANEEKFQPPPGSPEPTKCAEIFRRQQGSLLYVCLFCSKEMTKAVEFEQHLLDHFAEFVCQLNTTDEIVIEDVEEEEDPAFEDDLIELMDPQPSFDGPMKTNKIIELKITNISEKEIQFLEPRDNSIKCEFCQKDFLCCGLKGHHMRHIHKIKKAFYCSECNAGYSTEETLNKHMELHNILNLPTCVYCKKIFEFQSELNSHLNWSNRNNAEAHGKVMDAFTPNYKPHVCYICGKDFKHRSNCRAHVKRNHDDYIMYCDLCTFKSKDRTNLIVHMRIHTKERPYSCDICGKTFAQSSYVKIHKRIHTGEKPYQCNICGVSYYSAGNLNFHIRKNHSDNPPKQHPCQLCDRLFRSPFQLKIHMRTHTGEKPYHCPTCGASFTSNKILGQHKLIHSAEKRFICKFCGQGFAQSAGRRGHEKRVHEDDLSK